ncbi:MAG: adenosylcobinamide-GDP ribazoletransferase [Bacillota bacterium]
MKAWRRFLAAVAFLTRAPIPESIQVDEASLTESPPWFPAVGLLIGGFIAAFDWIASAVLPSAVVAVADLAAIFMITGGLHLDGLLDTADGLLSGKPREKALEIMKDSRVGAMGVSAGILVIALKAAAIASLAGDLRWQGLLLAPILGRYVMAVGISAFPYARGAGLGALFSSKANGQLTALSGIIVASLSVAVAGIRGAAGFLAAVLGSVLLARKVTRQLGGLTGDVYGALCELSETALLLVFAARWP